MWITFPNNNAIKLFGILPQEVERYRLRDFFVDADNRRMLSEHLEKDELDEIDEDEEDLFSLIDSMYEEKGE